MVYRIAAAVLAVGSGVVIAGLIAALNDDGDLNAGWFAVFALGALVAVGLAVVLWVRGARR